MTFKSIVYILLVLLFLSPTSSFCNKEDIEALLALKKAISNNTHGALDSWNPYNTSHPCNWTGISCTSTTNRVSNITLPAKNLSGRLVAELSNLTYLVHLELALNSFRGAIPSELGNLRALKVLDLNYNQLEGEIPSELGSLQSLQILNLGNNFNICGSIPSSLGQLKQLNTLSLLNNLLSGNIPPEIGQMPNLQYMFLSDNKLSGEIPEELGSISQLTYLSLEFNELSGSIPSQLGRLKKLQFLSLSGNQLSGTIPSELERLNDLRSLLLDSNRLSGEIPNEFGLLHNLQNLHLFSNRLSGNIPVSLANLTSLVALRLFNNKLSGFIPSALANCSNLLCIQADNNSLSGEIPSGFSSLRNLYVFSVEGNHIIGNIPSWFGDLDHLMILNLAQNRFSGSLPQSWARKDNLWVLKMAYNNLEGFLPDWVWKFKDLRVLDFSNNNFSGEISPDISQLQSYRPKLNFSHTDHNILLSDPIPLNFKGQAIFFPELYGREFFIDLSGNRLQGRIPTQVGALTDVRHLNLSRNELRGHIPPSIGNMHSLEALDLSRNHLDGLIPDQIRSLDSLGVLNLSYNKLSGRIPTGGHIDTLSSVPYEGNPNLCGTIISKPCLVKHSNITLERAHKKRASQNLIITVVASPTIAGAILIGFIIFYYWIRWRGSTNSHDVKILDIENGLKLMASDLFECTYGYSNANIIGRGSLSTVYKGILGSGHVYALKVFKVDEHENNIELVRSNFVNECKVLSQIRHRNIVRILGAYSDAHRKILVLPFMPNGSLDMHLHGSDTCHLTWEMRLKIASEVAQAMVYLHEESGVGQIVHCDLKPSNILLDQDFVAHVSDFGMASWVVDPNLNAPATFRGTIGYIAPETAYASKVSASMDVYGYGILLLEMVTRKRPTLSNEILNGKASSLHEWVQLLFADRLLEVVDPMLISNATTSTHDQIISVVKLGLSCSQQSPNHRPSMRVVMTKLQQITVPSSD
eukprot:Gb_11459 [translate_table: standard]